MHEDISDNKDHASFDLDVLHDYLSYFSENNPKELNQRYLKKKNEAKTLRFTHSLITFS